MLVVLERFFSFSSLLSLHKVNTSIFYQMNEKLTDVVKNHSLFFVEGVPLKDSSVIERYANAISNDSKVFEKWNANLKDCPSGKVYVSCWNQYGLRSTKNPTNFFANMLCASNSNVEWYLRYKGAPVPTVPERFAFIYKRGEHPRRWPSSHRKRRERHSSADS